MSNAAEKRNKENFGVLCLDNDQLKSKIVDLEQSLKLINLCEFPPTDKFTLLYRGSEDGFRSADFHRKCDGKANTLPIIKAKNSPNIFNGFNSVPWNQSGYYTAYSNAFIFSLINKDNRPIKMKGKNNDKIK